VVVIDDFLDNDVFNQIKNYMMGNNFPWFIQTNSDISNDNNKQLCHNFYDTQNIGFRPNSDAFEMLQPLIEKLNVQALIRIKANLTFIDNKRKNVFHTDNLDDRGNTTALFYITSGGGTKFEKDDKFVEAKPNRMVIFMNKEKHKVVKHQTDEPFRAIINFNYF
tara:strand:+ start:224 stop:715 length:492 start_codon:yes stop_codon:yes gene_type:complete